MKGDDILSLTKLSLTSTKQHTAPSESVHSTNNLAIIHGENMLGREDLFHNFTTTKIMKYNDHKFIIV